MIICSGEALIDMIPATCGDACEDGFIPRAGGSVFNTAIALGRLGANVGFVSGLSTDMFGEILEQTLRDSNVDLALCLRADRPTTMAYVKLTDGNASYLFHDENSAGRMITAEDMPEISPDVTAMFFGGISLAVEPCAEAYAALAEQAGAGRVVMVDPNIRPTFIPDEPRFRARLDRILRVADIVKVSDEDLGWLVPGDMSVDDRVAAVLSKGPSIVLVTAGGETARGYLSDGRVIEKTITPQTIVDTVGAGDSFNAGFLHSLQEQGLLTRSGIDNLSDAQMLDALTLGAAVAGVVVSRSGANPPWRKELIGVV